MTAEISHLSYSSISKFLECPEHWRRKYIEKQPTPTTPALLFGSAFHDTVERYLVSRGGILDEGTITDIWTRTWHRKTEESPDCEWGADTPEQHFNEGIRLLTTVDVVRMIDGIRLAYDNGEPVIERKLELRVPGVPVPVIGYMDMMTADGVPGDFKTSAQQWSMERAQGELQSIYYLAALNQAGYTVPGLRFRHYVVTKARQPKAQILEHSHTWDEIFWLYELIQRVWQAIEAEAFYPNPHTWLCSPRHCNFWSQCRGRGRGI